MTISSPALSAPLHRFRSELSAVVYLRFLQLCSRHLVEPAVCTPRAGWEKGQVESQVGHVRGRLFLPRPRGRSYAEINARLEDQCIAEAKRHCHPTIKDKSVWEVYEAERAYLMDYRGPFDGFHAVAVAVSKTCLVRFDRNRYSAESRAVGRTEDVCAYADRIVIRQNGETAGEHQSSFERNFANTQYSTPKNGLKPSF